MSILKHSLFMPHVIKAYELQNIPGASPPPWQWQLVQTKRLVLRFVMSHNMLAFYFLGSNRITCKNSNSNCKPGPKLLDQ